MRTEGFRINRQRILLRHGQEGSHFVGSVQSPLNDESSHPGGWHMTAELMIKTEKPDYETENRMSSTDSYSPEYWETINLNNCTVA